MSEKQRWSCRAQAGDLAQDECEKCRAHLCHACGTEKLVAFWHSHCLSCTQSGKYTFFKAHLVPEGQPRR